MSACVADDSTECDCGDCRSDQEEREGWLGWGDSDRSIYDDPCPSCGEPGLVGCDSSCPEEGRRLQEYTESEAAHSIGLALYNAARLEAP
jgi:hypothetical protein